ncbi:hypothetical protein BKA62DRAFT_36859 [Auriculariales sp. MPI-PUGE-AT-0066]|nr:hypothetical protein BKA62DRAFT_36859 [Auriculariales sp. MPI-PUGE-AT-0066]
MAHETTGDSQVSSEGRVSGIPRQIQRLLSTKVDAVPGQTAMKVGWDRAHRRIEIYKCFFCGWQPRADAHNKTRNDSANRHRVGGQRMKPCPIFNALGGYENMANVTSFLLTRWPELEERQFHDDQLNGTLGTALRTFVEHNLRELTAKATAARKAYLQTGTSPAAGQGLWDPELYPGLRVGDSEIDELDA